MQRHETFGKNMVGFLVGETLYAVDILRVREIVNPLPLVAVPHTPPHVVGVADHRGQTVPVVDLHVRFGLPPAEATRRTKWIIADVAGVDAGLWVDAVTSVFGVATGDVRPPPDLAVTPAARFIAGVTLFEGALVFLLDLDRIGTDDPLLPAAAEPGAR
jgi:purine-binding chemotaxis protein CheW